MYCIVYRFEVKDGQNEKFLNAWGKLTELILEHEGSLGSRVHQVSENEYYAYAQWPTKEQWERKWKSLPTESKMHSQNMREACSKVETLLDGEVIADYLKSDNKDK